MKDLWSYFNPLWKTIEKWDAKNYILFACAGLAVIIALIFFMT